MAASRHEVLYLCAMRFEPTSAAIESAAIETAIEPDPASASELRPYEAPGFEVISLACEISAYAPDGDAPLF